MDVIEQNVRFLNFFFVSLPFVIDYSLSGSNENRNKATIANKKQNTKNQKITFKNTKKQLYCWFTNVVAQTCQTKQNIFVSSN